MPSFIQYANCTVDGELADAALALGELLSDRTLLAMDLAARISATIPRLETSLRAPLTEVMESVIDLPLDDARTAICLPPVSTVDDVENVLRTRDGLNIVDGRIIMPGDLDIRSLRTMSRVFGSYQAAISRLEAVAPGTFLMVVTHVTTTVVPDDYLASLSSEVIIGVDVPLHRLLVPATDSVRQMIYFFWNGNPSATTVNLSRLSHLGVPTNYLADILNGEQSDILQSCIVRDSERLSSLGTLYGLDIDRVLAQGPDSIDPQPPTEDVLTSLANAISRRRPGSRTPCGTLDFNDPAPFLLATLDLEKTLKLKASLEECAGSTESPALAAVAGVIDRIISSVTTLLDVVRSSQMYLNEAVGLLSTGQSLFGGDQLAMLACLSRGVTGMGTAALRPHIQRIQNIMESSVEDFDTTINLVQDFYSTLAMILCLAQNIMAAICGGNLNVIPGLNCVNLNLSDFGFTSPECFGELCRNISEMLGLLNGCTGTTIGNLSAVKSLVQDMISSMASAVDASIAALTYSTTTASSHRSTARGDTSIGSPVCNPVQAQAFFGSLVRTLDVVGESEPMRVVLP